IAAAAVEQSHDADGIIWPWAIAPFHAHLVLVGARDQAQADAAEAIYRSLWAAGIETLFDDRDERPGVKFKDADLVGLPVRVTVGPRALARGCVELKTRTAREATEVPVGDAAARAAALLGARWARAGRCFRPAPPPSAT